MAFPSFTGYPSDSSAVERRVEDLEKQVKSMNNILRGWTGSGTDPYFDYIRAKDGFFDRPILESARVRRVDSSQTISNNTWTAINFDQQTYNTGLLSFSTATNSSRVRLAQPAETNNEKAVLFTGIVQFDSNSSGMREGRINLYNPSDISGGTVPMATNQATTAGGLTYSFAVPFRFNSSGAYITLEVYQNSGGDLGVAQVYLGALRVF